MKQGAYFNKMFNTIMVLLITKASYRRISDVTSSTSVKGILTKSLVAIVLALLATPAIAQVVEEAVEGQNLWAFIGILVGVAIPVTLLRIL